MVWFVVSTIVSGSVGSFTEYTCSRRAWSVRSAVGSVLVGGVMAVMVIGYLYYDQDAPEVIPVHVIGLSAASGYGHRKVWEVALRLLDNVGKQS